MKNKFESVWDALEGDPIKRENLKLRSMLLAEINLRLNQTKKTQVEIARQLQTTQPRVSALLNGRINEFRLDMLVDFALRLGLRVDIAVAA